MTKCPNCGTEVKEPVKSFKNMVFQIESYRCNVCNYHFREYNKQTLEITLQTN